MRIAAVSCSGYSADRFTVSTTPRGGGLSFGADDMTSLYSVGLLLSEVGAFSEVAKHDTVSDIALVTVRAHGTSARLRLPLAHRDTSKPAGQSVREVDG